MAGKLLTSLDPGYSALVIGASGGIGHAIADCLEADPNCSNTVQLSRRDDQLDITDEESVRRAADCFQAMSFDFIVCATGALTIDGVGPEKSIRQISQNAMMNQFAVNAIGPALLLKYFVPLLDRKKRVIFAFLSARVGSIGDNQLGGWISYRSSKAALNQIVHTAAIEVSRANPASVVVAIHPGSVATSLSDPFSSNHERSKPDDAARSVLQVLDGLQPANTGGFFAYDGSSIVW
ncbi:MULTISPECIES: SDR family NAD(P)-dependent oxidoreductase [unclassified Rhizobium]|jgi:NAD(P)-dependent dehydrogenase (short-subunit alcohol dehydrogenase family)|uniref:SDR family NAD(P)-dependent oxidoreductase n=1 Tax=unclassified Rhizobium TaxID=2613769 RepID=UPI000AFF2658|nr:MULTISPECIES: SDR family NAD(P)-dependent oxidoreductase [unclassified Rhizobium]RKD35720.1 NAD(P)-dependent dehydrogenase (short-subunit alcohol dehydrogenase family) [Rhizobium sp. WW_1]TIX93362.1 SDR family NAD(P)-dependent oxidoreductase [Rhizobium sp. P44RR-XXIV]